MDEPQENTGAVPEGLTRRAEFLHAAKGKRFYARGLTLQAAPRPIVPPKPVNWRTSGEPDTFGTGAERVQIGNLRGVPPCMDAPPRFGFTVTKHTGGAVQRNRIRRRLKEALRLLNPLPARPGYDYVILARPEALGMSFRSLQAELMRALGKIDTSKNAPPMRPNHDCNDTVSDSAGETRGKISKGRTPKG